jgi:hypothetical protein
MQPDEGFIVLEGPVCDDAALISWWKVSYSGVEGWTAEGEGEEYYLRPPDVEPGTSNSGGGGDGSGGGAVSDSGTENTLDPGAVAASLPESGSVTLEPGLLGIQLYSQISTTEFNSALSLTDSLGVGWIKVQANWRFLQPDEAGQVTPQLEAFYSHIADAKGRGYNVLVSVAKAPDWARSVTSNAGPPDDPAALATFLTEIIAASGGNIDAIEVWNEPNLSREWTGMLSFDGAGYMQLFGPAYDAIVAADSNITVVSAGLAPTSTTESTVDDRDFLRQMYGAGLANYANIAVGIHPYGWANAPDAICCDDASGNGWDDAHQFFFLNNVVAYRNIQLRFGHESALLWTTEFGYSSWDGFGGTPSEAWMGFLSGEQQAANIYRAFEVAQALDYMGPMMLWNLNFANNTTIAQRTEIAGFGLTVTDDNGNISTRPAFDSLVSRLP